MAHKNNTQEEHTGKRLNKHTTVFQRAYVSALEFSKQRLAISALGIGVMLTMRDELTFYSWEFLFWLVTNFLFLLSIVFILWMFWKEEQFFIKVAEYYENNMKESKDEADKINNLLGALNNFTNFFFASGILFAILFVVLGIF